MMGSRLPYKHPSTCRRRSPLAPCKSSGGVAATPSIAFRAATVAPPSSSDAAHMKGAQALSPRPLSINQASPTVSLRADDASTAPIPSDRTTQWQAILLRCKDTVPSTQWYCIGRPALSLRVLAEHPHVADSSCVVPEHLFKKQRLMHIVCTQNKSLQVRNCRTTQKPSSSKPAKRPCNAQAPPLLKFHNAFPSSSSKTRDHCKHASQEMREGNSLAANMPYLRHSYPA